jgi:L-threonylcarbamoyladenylate synthase
MTTIQKAVSLLNQGEVIITPSESSYGLTCDATNQKAIQKLHKIKQEPSDKPLIIAISDLNQLLQLKAVITEETKKLSRAFHPGQLNLIIPTTDNKTIAFRIPNNKTLQQLSQKLNKPITTTSANIHNKPPIYDLNELKQQFQTKVSLIIESGDLDPEKPSSTIYDTMNKKVLREGLITEKEIKKTLQQ